MATFSDPSKAIGSAVGIQRALRDKHLQLPGGETLAIRIGLHTGQPELLQIANVWDYDGHAINIASRIEGLIAGGGQILCSAATASLAGELPGVPYHECGAYALRGIRNEVTVYEVLWDTNQTPRPPERIGSELPYPWLTRWVGRDRESQDLSLAIADNRLVTVSGIGGVGKTRLAVETLLQVQRKIGRQVNFVPLEDCANNPEAFLQALRDSLQIGEGEAPTIEGLCEWIGHRKILLVLDNFEVVTSAVSSVQKILALTPSLSILVTSQQTLMIPGESVLTLSTMPTDGAKLDEVDSYRLFSDIARSRDGDWCSDDLESVRSILSLTDGLPYIIELIAVRAPFSSLRDLRDELSDRLLNLKARPAASARHASLQACLDWSSGHLSQAAREGLAAVSIFVGGFTGAAARQVCLLNQDTLDDLVNSSLIRFDYLSARYSILPTTRQFALNLPQQDDVPERRTVFFIDLLGGADRDLFAPGTERRASARKSITTEVDNIRAAIDWSGRSNAQHYLRGVLNFTRYLHDRHLFAESIRLSEDVLTRIQGLYQSNTWAGLKTNLGAAYLGLQAGNRDSSVRRSISCFEEALTVFTETAFPNDWAMIQNNLGNAYLALPSGVRPENVARAINCYLGSLRVRTERETPLDWAISKLNLSQAYFALPGGDRARNLGEFIAHTNDALRVLTESMYPHEWAIGQMNLGLAYSELGSGDSEENLHNAVRCLECSLRVLTRTAFPYSWASVQNALGAVYLDSPYWNRTSNQKMARSAFTAALEVFTETEHPQDWANCQNNLGKSYFNDSSGNQTEFLQKSIAYFEASMRVRTKDAFPRDWASAQNNIGAAYSRCPTRNRGTDLQKAIEHYEAALQVRTREEYPVDWSFTNENLGRIYSDYPIGIHADNIVTAQRFLRLAEVGFEQTGLRANADRVRSHLAMISQK